MRRNSNEKRNRRKRIGRSLVIMGLALFGLFAYMDMQMRPIIKRTADYQCKVIAAGVLNEALLSELNSEMCDYSSLITLRENENGEIISIESNMLNINRLKVRSTELINQAIKNTTAFNIEIPLGTVSGIPNFYGKGPKMPVNITPKGSIKTNLVSEFSEAGINQTLHRIVMEIEMELSAVVPGATEIISIKTELLIAETVIIGNVPNTYLKL